MPTDPVVYDNLVEQKQLAVWNAASAAIVAQWLATDDGRDMSMWPAKMLALFAGLTKDGYRRGLAQSYTWRRLALGLRQQQDAPRLRDFVFEVNRDRLKGSLEWGRSRMGPDPGPVGSTIIEPLVSRGPGYGNLAPNVQAAVRANVGSMMRLVTDAQMQAVEDYANADRRALGWVRVTAPGCCSFCAMLASRGAVYAEHSFDATRGRFSGVTPEFPDSARVHDGCRCRNRPIYSLDEVPQANLAFQELWSSVPSGRGGKDSLRLFRAAYEGRELRMK